MVGSFLKKCCSGGFGVLWLQIMKLLLLTENWPPRLGGIENYLTRIVSHLKNYEVTVVAPKIKGGKFQLSVDEGNVIRKRFFWPLLRPGWLPLFVWLYRMAKRENYDVVLCGKALFDGLAGYYLKKYLGIPYVVFTYAMEVETWSKNSGQRRKLELVLKNADRVIYINEVTKRLLIKLGVAEKELVRIWPGVDDSFFEKVPEEEAQLVLGGYRITPPYVLCVARLIERKGIDGLIEAFSQLDQTKFGDYQLIVVGEGPERGQLEQLIEKLWMNKSVQLVGEVPTDRLHALYQKADVFALTPRVLRNDFEGFGIVYLEAAAAGLPVIGTKTGGVVEAVAHDQTGLLVEPDSIEKVQRALESLLGNSELREKLGQRGRRRAYAQFRWHTRIGAVQQMLREVTQAKT